jgi:hypothetical protein
MPPEQAGENPRLIGPHSDEYSLGALPDLLGGITGNGAIQTVQLEPKVKLVATPTA